MPTEKDQAEIEAEALLPCRMLDGSTCSGNPSLYEHSEACPAFYRPAVAAKLKERDERIDELVGFVTIASRTENTLRGAIEAIESMLADKKEANGE